MLYLIIFFCLLLIIYLVYKINTFSSLDKANAARLKKKEEAKEKVLELLNKQGKITNDEVEKMLGVSDSTAQRYLQELVKEGEITQQGEKKGIFYIK